MRRAVDANRKQMRIRGERFLPADVVEGIPAGSHEFSFGESNGELKKYVVFVTPGTGGGLVRTA